MIVCLRLEKILGYDGNKQDQTLHRDRSVTFRFFCVFNPFQDFRGEMIDSRKEWPRLVRLTSGWLQVPYESGLLVARLRVARSGARLHAVDSWCGHARVRTAFVDARAPAVDVGEPAGAVDGAGSASRPTAGAGSGSQLRDSL